MSLRINRATTPTYEEAFPAAFRANPLAHARATVARQRAFDVGIIARLAKVEAEKARLEASLAEELAAAKERREATIRARVAAERAKWAEAIDGYRPARDLIGPVRPAPSPIVANRILAEVCAQHKVSHRALIGPVRLAYFVRARQEAMWRVRASTGWSLPRIGRLLGGRDHTTILHGIRKHQERLDRAARLEGAQQG